MAITLIQQVTGSLVSGTGNMTASLATTATGNTLVVGISIAPATTDVTTALGDGTNTLARIGLGTQLNNVSGLGFVVLYYKENITGLTTPTMTWQHSGTQSACMVVAEYSGLLTSGSLDQSKYGTGTGTALSTGASGVTTNANEVVVAFGGTDFGNNAYTLGAGYGHLKQAGNINADGAMEDKIISSTGAQTATLTASTTDWGMGLATFIGATSPAVNFIKAPTVMLSR